MTNVTMDGQGRVRIPQDLRAALELQPGDTLAIEQDGNQIRLVRVADPFGPVARAVIAEEAANPGKSVEELAVELGIDLTARNAD